MSKRRASGARPPAKKGAAPHARHLYVLRTLHEDGSLVECTDDELFAFQGRWPEVMKKWSDSAAIDAGLERGSWQERCWLLLDSLLKQKKSKIFQEPVDPVRHGVPDYTDVIKEPMDLGTIKKRILAHPPYYTSVDQFAAAMRLVFTNAMLYNVANTVFHEDAKKLLASFERKLSSEVLAEKPAAAAGAEAGAAAGDPAAAGSGGYGGAEPSEADASELDPSEDDFGGDGDDGDEVKGLLSDDDDDDDDDDESGAGGGAQKAPASAAEGAAEGAARPSVGGKCPPGMDDDDDASQAEISESGAEYDDEGVSESDMFGDDEEGEEGSVYGESEAGNGEGSSAGGGDGDGDDSIFDDEGEDDA